MGIRKHIEHEKIPLLEFMNVYRACLLDVGRDTAQVYKNGNEYARHGICG